MIRNDNYWLGVTPLYLVMASAVTLALHYLAHLPWGWAALAAFVAWPLIGTLVTIDDELPGGWSNPEGKARPDWLTARFWGPICFGLAVTCFAAVIDTGLGSPAANAFAGIGAIALILWVLLARKRSRSVSG